MTVRRHPLLRTVAGLAVVVLAAVGLAACGDDEDTSNGSDETTTTAAAESGVTVSDAWVRPVEDLTAKDTTAIYMTITAGPEGDSLTGASVPSDVASTVELHETVTDSGDSMGGDMASTTAMGGDMASTTTMAGGMMSMQPVDSIEVPADGSVELEPGGYHLMVMGVKKTLAVGDTVEVTLTFARAGTITTTAEVREP